MKNNAININSAVNFQDFLSENFFNRMLQLYNVKKKRVYPDLNNTLEMYFNILTNSDLTRNLGNEGNQIYRKEYIIDELNSYFLEWSKEIAEDIIKKYNIPITLFKVSEVIDAVDQKNINSNVLKGALINNKPIILAHIPVHRQNIIIDGNHRVYSKYKNQNKYIQGYMLNSLQQIEAMTADIFKNLYKVYDNMLLIFNYIGGFYDWNYISKEIHKF